MNGAGLALVNGVRGETWALDDRAAQYGDGVFRTLILRAGQPRWWPDHFAKLGTDCAALGLPAPNEADWLADLTTLARQYPDATVKLIVSRGGGPRGYAPPVPLHCTRVAIAYPVTADSSGLDEAGITTRFCDLRLAWQPRLAGVKHLNRLENVLARLEWDDPAIAEGILRDASERVISGVSANLFILRGKQLLTPRLDRCGIAGVARARLLRAAARVGLSAAETELDGAAVLGADALMFCNSVTGLRWVSQLRTETGEVRIWTKPSSFDRLQELLDD